MLKEFAFNTKEKKRQAKLINQEMLRRTLEKLKTCDLGDKDYFEYVEFMLITINKNL